MVMNLLRSFHISHTTKHKASKASSEGTDLHLKILSCNGNQDVSETREKITHIIKYKLYYMQARSKKQ